MRTEQNKSTDWKKIREGFEAGTLSIRKLAERFKVSDTAIRKRAKKEGWEPFGSKNSGAGSRREPPTANLPAIPDIVAKAAADGVSFDDLAKDMGRRLLDELDTMTSRQGELEEMIEDYTFGDKDTRRYNALMKAISHATRTQSYKNLAHARKAFAEGAPGKKQQAQDAAETAGGEGTGWGSDLDVGVARAN